MDGVLQEDMSVTVIPDGDPSPNTPPEANSSTGLTDQESAILSFERQWWRFDGAKDQAVRELFGVSATRYYQLLNALIDRPEALAADPMLVKRLRRMRSARHDARAARRDTLRSSSG